MNPWNAMDLKWQEQSLRPADVVRVLTEAGAIDPISPEALAARNFKSGCQLVMDLLSHDNANPRLIYCVTNDIGNEYHYDQLFANLARAARPPVEVEAVSQVYNRVTTVRDASTAGLQMNLDGEVKPVPEQLLAGIPLVSYEGSTYVVRFRFRGQERQFTIRPCVTVMDVPPLLRAFNDFMQEIGRDERAFRFADDPATNYEYALFTCAPADRFRAAAARLGIPLHED